MVRWCVALWVVSCTTQPTDPSDADATDVTDATGSTGVPSGDTGSGAVELTTALGDTLVVPHAAGITFAGLDGSVTSSFSWTELVGGCGSCAGEGASPDGDGLLVSFTTGGTGGLRAGGVARVGTDAGLGFRMDGFAFPHDAIRDPSDDSVVVVETGNNQLVWVDGLGRTEKKLRTLTSNNSEFPNTPNGAERVQVDGRTYLLVSHRPASGRISFWDITDPEAVTFVWRFPAKGTVATPHGPILRRVEGVWWLLWAHTEGVGRNDGSVGLARTADVTTAPTYVADLQPNSATGSFRFLRGVELTDDLRLIVTDSGRGQRGGGRVLEASWPDLSPPKTGETGAEGSRWFIDLGATEELLTGVQAPFEAWLWDRALVAP